MSRSTIWRPSSSRTSVITVVKPDAEQLRAFVRQRPDVHILAVARHLDKLRGYRGKLLVLVGEIDAHDPARAAEAVVMLPHAEDVDLALVFVPVAAYALEHRRAVVEGVRHHANLCLRERQDLPVEVGIRRRPGRSPLRLGRLKYMCDG